MGLGPWHVDVRMLAKLVGDPGGGGLHGADDDEFRKARSSHVFPFTRLFRRDGISGGEDRSPDAPAGIAGIIVGVWGGEYGSLGGYPIRGFAVGHSAFRPDPEN